MTNVSVITGGAGGMGLATAKIVGRDHFIVLSDVRQDRLDAAADELKKLEIACTAVVCDITERKSVDELVEASEGHGTVTSVIHTAGVSPSMGSAELIMKINAMGTVHVNEGFLQLASDGFAIVNVASMAAHMLPRMMLPAPRSSTRCSVRRRCRSFDVAPRQACGQSRAVIQPTSIENMA